MNRIAVIALSVVLTACGSSRPRPSSALRPSRLHELLTSTTGLDHPVAAVLHAPFAMVQIAGVRLDLHPAVRDPITALGACTDLVTRCYNPPSRSLDTCVATVPRCTTAAPWTESPCCPAECDAGYRDARMRGATPFDAFERVYLDVPTCVAGVSATLAAQR